MRQIVYKIQRFDGTKAFEQEYRFNYEAGKTILWGLITIKETIDPTLTFVASCRSAVCGACAVRVNNQAMLVCEVSLDETLARFGDTLEIAPLNNFKVVRDLVVDWEPKAARLNEAKPWLVPQEKFSVESGCRQTQAEFKKFNKQTECILCGACASECNKLSMNETDFYEPYVYSKTYKFLADSRDGAPLEHLAPVVGGGVWKCVHCEECVAKCPKGLEPAEDISKTRQAAIAHKLIKSVGARHALAFYDDIVATGRLDETQLAVKTEGMLKSISRLPFALRLLRKGKLNPLHRPAPVKGIDQIRAIVRAVKEEK
ncbi:MAG: succinate dehydrogenase/fumarate reductase iron-sulfur subunit [Negativicutes bacterium]|nr:succinate dehydrogenase/fumarate reductase iron-sulfur subunit [Negativicutes bacterium]